jgi:hypothetical protein
MIFVCYDKSMIDIFAITVSSILAGLAVFQIALAAGAPIGKYAWGGAHTVLPTQLRVGSIISVLLYGFITAIILSKADVLPIISPPSLVNTWTWIIAAYFTVGIVMNGISRSKPERNLMTPIVLILAVGTMFIALS